MLSGIKLILNNHKWAIILAILVAVIIAYPQVYFRYDHQDAYHGIELIGASDDESVWSSRVREAQDGHLSLSCVYFKDGKNDPYIIQPLGSTIVAYLGKIFSLDLNNTILFSRLFFPFIVFLIIYGFILLFTKDKLTALVTPSALFLASTLLGRWDIFQLLSGESPKTDFLLLTRPVNPALTWFFFFGFLLFFWLYLEKKQWRWGILSALMLGLSFYDYFYTWTFLYVFCGVLGLIFLFQKNWRELKRIAVVLLGAGLIAIPYLINFYQITTYPTYQEVGQRAGLLYTREPTLGFLVPFIFIIFLLFFPRKWRERYYFALALVITPFIVLNQQLITGKTLFNAHYHWYFHTPLGIIFLLVIFFNLISQKKREFFKKLSAILIIAIGIYTGVLIQNSSYNTNEEKIIERQRYGQVMDWLDENTEKDEVIFANNETAHLIVIYTPLNVFYHSSAGGCLVSSKDRLLNTLFLFYRLDGVDKEDAQEVFFRDRRKMSAAIYGTYYRETTGVYENIPDEILREIIQKYQASFSVPTTDFLNNLWTKYEVKYLVWDKESNPQWQLNQYSFLKKVAEIEDFAIYQRD